MFVFDLFRLFAITVPPIGVTLTAVGAVGAILSTTISPVCIAETGPASVPSFTINSIF